MPTQMQDFDWFENTDAAQARYNQLMQLENCTNEGLTAKESFELDLLEVLIHNLLVNA